MSGLTISENCHQAKKMNIVYLLHFFVCLVIFLQYTWRKVFKLHQNVSKLHQLHETIPVFYNNVDNSKIPLSIFYGGSGTFNCLTTNKGALSHLIQFSVSLKNENIV